MKLYLSVSFLLQLENDAVRERIKDEVCYLTFHKEKPVDVLLSNNTYLVDVDLVEKDVIVLTANKWVPVVDRELGKFYAEHKTAERFTYHGPGSVIKGAELIEETTILDEDTIPRITVVTPVTDITIFDSPLWYAHKSVAALVKRHAPKWEAEGFVVGKVGINKIRIVYIPVTVNTDHLMSVFQGLGPTIEVLLTEINKVFISHTEPDGEHNFLDRF